MSILMEQSGLKTISQDFFCAAPHHSLLFTQGLCPLLWVQEACASQSVGEIALEEGIYRR